MTTTYYIAMAAFIIGLVIGAILTLATNHDSYKSRAIQRLKLEQAKLKAQLAQVAALEGVTVNMDDQYTMRAWTVYNPVRLAEIDAELAYLHVGSS